ncbi:hypothetical protein SI65_06389 [Aspergillus cristatus]|uniref:Uncharacterized protein n=1 Tax=Aspergillus cristatus TaxID=573508 RepID=A0A1E3BC36_ASPCR|nr:hypothetical protein SI65_06389 [Aspergillus cristatus]
MAPEMSGKAFNAEPCFCQKEGDGKEKATTRPQNSTLGVLVRQKAAISTPFDEDAGDDQDQNPIKDDPANFLQTFNETLIDPQLLKIDDVNLRDEPEVEGYLAENEESNAFICTDSAFDPDPPQPNLDSPIDPSPTERPRDSPERCSESVDLIISSNPKSFVDFFSRINTARVGGRETEKVLSKVASDNSKNQPTTFIFHYEGCSYKTLIPYKIRQHSVNCKGAQPEQTAKVFERQQCNKKHKT